MQCTQRRHHHLHHKQILCNNKYTGCMSMQPSITELSCIKKLNRTHHQSHPQPQSKMGYTLTITINTVITVLSTVISDKIQLPGNNNFNHVDAKYAPVTVSSDCQFCSFIFHHSLSKLRTVPSTVFGPTPLIKPE